MSDNFSKVGNITTPLTYNELSYPKVIDESEDILKKLKGVNGDDIFSLYSILETISTEVQNTKQSDLDTLWNRIEKKLYNGKTLKTNSSSDREKLNTLLGTFFVGLKEFDATNDIEAVRAFSTLYNEISFFAEQRFVSTSEGRERLVTQRVIDVTGSFLTRVNRRYNNFVDQGLMQGPKL